MGVLVTQTEAELQLQAPVLGTGNLYVSIPCASHSRWAACSGSLIQVALAKTFGCWRSQAVLP